MRRSKSPNLLKNFADNLDEVSLVVDNIKGNRLVAITS